jgi:hypothetical protein
VTWGPVGVDRDRCRSIDAGPSHYRERNRRRDTCRSSWGDLCRFALSCKPREGILPLIADQNGNRAFDRRECIMSYFRDGDLSVRYLRSLRVRASHRKYTNPTRTRTILCHGERSAGWLEPAVHGYVRRPRHPRSEARAFKPHENIRAVRLPDSSPTKPRASCGRPESGSRWW